MSVDAIFAQWLQSDADYVLRTDAGATARWGPTALTTERRTGIATQVGAEQEADRQLAFFARGPFAVEIHSLEGTDWATALGRVIKIVGDKLGYDAGIDVFVIGAEADRATGISQVTVIRPLRAV